MDVWGRDPEVPTSVAARLTLVLDCFGEPQTLLTLEEVTVRSGLTRSSAYRLLRQLSALGWLERWGVRYRLGFRALGFGETDTQFTALRRLVTPMLRSLSAQTKMNFRLGVLVCREVRVLDVVGTGPQCPGDLEVGDVVPAAETAMGRALLAGLSPDDLDQWITDNPQSLPPLAAVVRGRGAGPVVMAGPRGELLVHSAADVIRGSRGSVAAIGVSHPSANRVAGVVNALGVCARRLSAAQREFEIRNSDRMRVANETELLA